MIAFSVRNPLASSGKRSRRIGVVPGETGAVIDLQKIDADAKLLVRAFEILICDGVGVAGSDKMDRFADDLRQRFISSLHWKFHQALFDLSQRFCNVWVDGTKNYAIRVAHERYGNGVSLVRRKPC